ncbi:hypothetical protein LTR36_005378 [Oleoguttula mirabilis]|uniref:mRNA export factor GLE1 n=1 Tax=Oleoguttula mirabilis TaxID=1507867 RepID=A0AAV9JG04_9PEZI|nr:hypothetical protein LTR36_005378 [Oleoguttula mirabilis]
MSSPFRSSDHSRSTPRSSPSRQRLNDSRSGRVNGHHRGARESLNDSPARQLWDEFNRLVIDEDNAFNRSLDIQDAEQAKLHREALDRALQEHEAVRQSAERAREQLELEIKREHLRREDEEKRGVEKARRELAEEEAGQQRRQLEEATRQEEERKQRELLKREQEEQQRRVEAQKQREEQEKAERKAAQEKEEADRKAREEAAARQRQQQAQKRDPPLPQQAPPPPQPRNAFTTSLQPPQPAQPPTAQQQAPTAQSQPTNEAAKHLVSSVQEREAVHRRYLDLWQRLKVMRKSIEQQCQAAGFKDLGNWRRDMRSRLGQLNKVDRQANVATLRKVRAVLDQAARMTEPSVDASQFIISPDQPPAPENGNTRMSGILVYLLSQLAKGAIEQLITESSVDTAMADPIGVLLCSIFSLPDYRCNGQSLIDVLWAKYHRVCPPLFGISGSENTEQGRLRLGWEAKWVDGAQAHYTRMTGLGAGFSALTLRDFSKSRNRNPAPNRLWWESMARILNLGPNEVQPTHYILVKAMVNDFTPRILQIFASAGKAALRKAVRDFPQIGPRNEKGGLVSSVVAVESMQVTLQQQYGLTL